MGILSAILWAPAMGALLLTLIAGRDADVSRNLGNLFATITFLLACYLLFSFDQHDAGLQFSEYFSINPKVGSAYALGVDGLSMPMVAQEFKPSRNMMRRAPCCGRIYRLGVV